MWSLIEVSVESDDVGSEPEMSGGGSSRPIGCNVGTSSFAALYMRSRRVYR